MDLEGHSRTHPRIATVAGDSLDKVLVIVQLRQCLSLFLCAVVALESSDVEGLNNAGTHVSALDIVGAVIYDALGASEGSGEFGRTRLVSRLLEKDVVVGLQDVAVLVGDCTLTLLLHALLDLHRDLVQQLEVSVELLDVGVTVGGKGELTADVEVARFF